jgi:hypothetical protein
MSQYVHVPGQGWFPTSGQQHCMGSSATATAGLGFSHFSPQQRLPGHAHGPQTPPQTYQQPVQQQSPSYQQQHQMHHYQPVNASYNATSHVPNTQLVPYRPYTSSTPATIGAPNADSIRFCDLVYGWGDKWGLPQEVITYLNNGVKGPMPDLTAFNAARQTNMAAVEPPLPNPGIADSSSVLSQVRYDGFNVLDTPWKMAGPEHGAPLPCPEMLPAVPALPMDLYQPGMQGLVGQGRMF